ncbi:hypothetical protein CHELA41_50324 [Hyphomicrobiales bacterium]|nr:hypothetical protein CHELA41_50324 [Hyphomicrobiales bacterium]
MIFSMTAALFEIQEVQMDIVIHEQNE